MQRPRQSKPTATSGVSVKRYFPGKAPEGSISDISASDSESEAETSAAARAQHIAIAKLADTRISGEAVALGSDSDSGSDSAKRLLQARLRARQQAAEASNSSSESSSSESCDELNRVNRRERALMMRRDREQSKSEESEAESSSESESESDDADGGLAPQIMLKPLFVPKSQRLAQARAPVGQGHSIDQSTEAWKQERREESVRLAAAEAKRAREAPEIKNQDESMVDDSDNIDVGAEFEAWKLRELLRIKRDKEEQAVAEQEETERERVRNMTEEERHAAGLERARKQREEKAQQRADLAAEEHAAPVVEAGDKLAQEMLEYALKRDKPRASNSKWRGYRNEDTSSARSLWAEGRRAPREAGPPGGRYRYAGDRSRSDE
ncbi:hypothetical protein H4S02_008732 [Coemansia sp. RSA 2611]|nr:hypothetical protein H4S02_008732 [Coemansia sp. RSA 2611]